MRDGLLVLVAIELLLEVPLLELVIILLSAIQLVLLHLLLLVVSCDVAGPFLLGQL